MASSVPSLSLPAISISKSETHPTPPSIVSLKYHVRPLSSSLVGTSLSIRKTKIPRLVYRVKTYITCSTSSSSTIPSALLFDCDGVLVDTEKDGHRISFNDTFKEVSILWFLTFLLFLFFFLVTT